MMAQAKNEPALAHWRNALHQVIFESDTRAGKTFDIVLLVSIIASVVVVMLESVPSIRAVYGPLFRAVEWFFTVLFTVEYVLRLVSLRTPLRYVFTFFGVVDLLSILPGYISVLYPSGEYLLIIRIFRLLRVFRIFKLSEYLSEADIIMRALKASARKISVFLLTVITVVIIIGTLMYVVEGEEHGFTDIPTSIYWAVVTVTTVGYGDLAPRTWQGQMLASVAMLLGYGIIAVPTGIVTVGLTQTMAQRKTGQACPNCGREGHDDDAVHCKYCGATL